MNLTEHTGHGIPAILAKYGEEAFDIGDSYIMVTIPFYKEVLNIASCKQNIGINISLNATDKKVISILLENPESTADNIALAIGVTKRTVERTLKKLQEKDLIVRTGAKKSGKWIVIK
jgi:predicted HTH transcriptional regulator